MKETASPNRQEDDKRKRQDQELDEALAETFPASDPIEPEQPGGGEK